MHAVDTEIMRRTLTGEKWEVLGEPDAISESQVEVIKFILANQIAIDHFNSEKDSFMEQIKPR